MSFPVPRIPEKLVRPVMPELDSLRGVAILLVLFFHGFNRPGALEALTGPARDFVYLATGGWVGVNLFFVLSGFLITGILLDSRSKPQYYKRFYIRRALRILPAFYLLLLFLCVLARIGWLDHRRIGWPFITLSFFYLANVTTFFGVPGQYMALWSLAVEEHFYLLWPTVVRQLSKRAIAWCAIAVVVACPALRAVGYRLGYNYGAGYTWLVADGLALGALVGVLSRTRFGTRRAICLFSIFSFVAAIGLLTILRPFGIWRQSTFAGGVFQETAVNVFSAAILTSTLLLGTSRFQWIVNRPVLQWFGRISYGLYLIHMLAFDVVDHWIIHYYPSMYPQIPSHFGLTWIRFLLGAAVGVGCAFLSRRYFEEWFLRFKDRWSSGVRHVPADEFIPLAPEAAQQVG
jgi:peptidoglycan/LPS O-acetylase OafA/YrhL